MPPAGPPPQMQTNATGTGGGPTFSCTPTHNHPPIRTRLCRGIIHQQVGRALAHAEGPQQRRQEQPEHQVLQHQDGAVHHRGHKQGQEDDGDGGDDCEGPGVGQLGAAAGAVGDLRAGAVLGDAACLVRLAWRNLQAAPFAEYRSTKATANPVALTPWPSRQAQACWLAGTAAAGPSAASHSGPGPSPQRTHGRRTRRRKSAGSGAASRARPPCPGRSWGRPGRPLQGGGGAGATAGG